MENLYLYDYGTTLKWETSDVLKIVAINDKASDPRIQTVTVKQNKIMVEAMRLKPLILWESSWRLANQ